LECKGVAHTFGGDWTEDKLEVMRRYFSAYAIALKGQRFAKWYVDAFAGTGERTESKPASANQASLLGDDEADVATAKDGSVRIALGIVPEFKKYVLIESSKARAAELEKLKTEFPNQDIDIRVGDANEILRSLAQSTNWRATRAAVFVDPYGMQVNWDTLKALAATKAVDIALLFPTGPLNRMLTRDGVIPAEWAKRIDDHLGPCDWRNATYKETTAPDLFSDNASMTKKRLTTGGLRRFVFNRLKTIFAFVSETQLELKNSKGATLYHLFIICANPSDAAIKLAEKLAHSAMRLPRKPTR
jgi:three-Cys-motif partner protein